MTVYEIHNPFHKVVGGSVRPLRDGEWIETREHKNGSEDWVMITATDGTPCFVGLVKGEAAQ